MDTVGIVVLVVGALVVGFLYHYVGTPREGYGWLVSAVGALIGGFAGSESLGTYSTWGPEWGGLFVLPALIGAVIVGGVVEWIVRTAWPADRTRTAH